MGWKWRVENKITTSKALIELCVFFGNLRSLLSPSARHRNWRNIRFLANFPSVLPNGKIRKFCNLHKLHVSPSLTSVMTSKPMLFGEWRRPAQSEENVAEKFIPLFSLSLPPFLDNFHIFSICIFPLGAAVSFKHDVGKAANIVIGKYPEELFHDLFLSSLISPLRCLLKFHSKLGIYSPIERRKASSRRASSFY